jgi:hypothetical protein
MKAIIHIILVMFTLFFSACEKEYELLNIEKEVITDTTAIDTSTTINNNVWIWKSTEKNDVLIDSLVIYPDETRMYKSYTLYANDNGYYSFDFGDNQRKNITNNTYEYADSIIINNDNINFFSNLSGNIAYKIEELTDSTLSISYTSIFSNDIKINLIKDIR